MFDVATDGRGRTMTVCFAARVDTRDVASCLDHLDKPLAEMESGFRVLADLSRLEWMDVECAPMIGAMMDSFRRRGASTLVMVVPHPEREIGLGILALFHFGGNATIASFKTMEEALQFLSQDDGGADSMAEAA